VARGRRPYCSQPPPAPRPASVVLSRCRCPPAATRPLLSLLTILLPRLTSSIPLETLSVPRCSQPVIPLVLPRHALVLFHRPLADGDRGRIAATQIGHHLTQEILDADLVRLFAARLAGLAQHQRQGADGSGKPELLRADGVDLERDRLGDRRVR